MQRWAPQDSQDYTRRFFAQREAAETAIFLTEARADLLQGITIPRDEPSDEQKANGFAIPYHHNGEPHDYIPDFLIRLKCDPPLHVILETKGYNPLEDVKRGAAERWAAAVNADGTFGRWRFVLIKKPFDIGPALTAALQAANELEVDARAQ